MTELELRAIFEFLHQEFNKDGLLYFKLLNDHDIGAYFKDTNKLFATFYLDKLRQYIKPELPQGAKKIKISHICDATRVLAQYETWLKEEKDTVYRDCGHHQQICTECWNKLQEIKERITNEKEKVQNNQK